MYYKVTTMILNKNKCNELDWAVERSIYEHMIKSFIITKQFSFGKDLPFCHCKVYKSQKLKEG